MRVIKRVRYGEKENKALENNQQISEQIFPYQTKPYLEGWSYDNAGEIW